MLVRKQAALRFSYWGVSGHLLRSTPWYADALFRIILDSAGLPMSCDALISVGHRLNSTENCADALLDSSLKRSAVDKQAAMRVPL